VNVRDDDDDDDCGRAGDANDPHGETDVIASRAASDCRCHGVEKNVKAHCGLV
jgi:hypothetical protein